MTTLYKADGGTTLAEPRKFPTVGRPFPGPPNFDRVMAAGVEGEPNKSRGGVPAVNDENCSRFVRAAAVLASTLVELLVF